MPIPTPDDVDYGNRNLNLNRNRSDNDAFAIPCNPSYHNALFIVTSVSQQGE